MPVYVLVSVLIVAGLFWWFGSRGRGEHYDRQARREGYKDSSDFIIQWSRYLESLGWIADSKIDPQAWLNPNPIGSFANKSKVPDQGRWTLHLKKNAMNADFHIELTKATDSHLEPGRIVALLDMRKFPSDRHSGSSSLEPESQRRLAFADLFNTILQNSLPKAYFDPCAWGKHEWRPVLNTSLQQCSLCGSVDVPKSKLYRT